MAHSAQPTPSTQPTSSSPGLQRQIGLWSAITIVIGTTIGSGIFRSPAGIAERLPGPLPLAAIWVAGGLLALCGALSLAEVASALPRTGGHFTPAVPPGSFSISAFGLALVSVLWVYDGWADLSFAGGEVKDPERNLPRALIGGTVAVIVIYLLANIGYLSVLSVDEIRHSRLVAADVASRLLGSAGVVFVSVTVMISTFGSLAGSLLTSPRIFFAMADEGLFFRPVAKVHPQFHT